MIRLPANPDGIDFGAFNPLSYQVLFVAGLAFGTKRLSFSRVPPRIRQWMLVGAVAVTTLFFALRQEYALEGPIKPTIDGFGMAFSIVQLGPLRLLNFAAFAFLLLPIVRRFRRPDRPAAAVRWLAFIGEHSLPVFAWSVLTTYAAMALSPSLSEQAHRLRRGARCGCEPHDPGEGQSDTSPTTAAATDPNRHSPPPPAAEPPATTVDLGERGTAPTSH